MYKITNYPFQNKVTCQMLCIMNMLGRNLLSYVKCSDSQYNSPCDCFLLVLLVKKNHFPSDIILKGEQYLQVTVFSVYQVYLCPSFCGIIHFWFTKENITVHHYPNNTINEKFVWKLEPDMQQIDCNNLTTLQQLII